MRLTIWQFLGLIAALVVGYLIYSMWWTKQDQNGWIRKFNGGATGNADPASTTKSGESDKPRTPDPW